MAKKLQDIMTSLRAKKGLSNHDAPLTPRTSYLHPDAMQNKLKAAEPVDAKEHPVSHALPKSGAQAAKTGGAVKTLSTIGALHTYAAKRRLGEEAEVEEEDVDADGDRDGDVDDDKPVAKQSKKGRSLKDIIAVKRGQGNDHIPPPSTPAPEKPQLGNMYDKIPMNNNMKVPTPALPSKQTNIPLKRGFEKSGNSAYNDMSAPTPNFQTVTPEDPAKGPLPPKDGKPIASGNDFKSFVNKRRND